MAYETILAETKGRVGIITLNRPKVLNALNDELMDRLGAALIAFDADQAIGLHATHLVDVFAHDRTCTVARGGDTKTAITVRPVTQPRPVATTQPMGRQAMILSTQVN